MGVEQPQGIASFRVFDAAGEDTRLQELVEMRERFLSRGGRYNRATTKRDRSGMNAVAVHQCEGTCCDRVRAPFTVVTKLECAVLQDPTGVVLLEKSLRLVPNEGPMSPHRPVLLRPARPTE